MKRRKRRFVLATAILTAWTMLAAVPALATPPTVTSDIASGHVFNTPQPTFRGTATDDVAVMRVDVAIRREDPLLWLQPDGSFGTTFSRRGAEMTQRSAPVTNWSWTPRSDLSDGEYRLWVAAWDGDGNRTTLKPQVRFTIATDGLPTPSLNTIEEDGPSLVTFRGVALDDSAVERVRIGIKQSTTQLWLQPDGTFGPQSRRFTASLANAGSNATTWSFTTELPDGRYVVSVRAFDDEGNSASIRPWHRFKLDRTGPTIEPSFPFGAALLGPDVVINGRATDESLIGAIKVAIKDRNTGLWLQPDGSFGPTHRKMHAGSFTCDPDWRPFCLPGFGNGFGDEAIIAWAFGATLPPGDYALSVRGWDARGNVASVRPWRHFTVDPTVDTLPVPTADLLEGHRFTESVVTVSGQAADDLGIARVRVGIKDRDTGMWWNGFRFTDRFERFDADVGELGAQTTGWSFDARLPNGRYALSVRAFDVQGYSQPIRPWIKFEVESDGPQIDVAFGPSEALTRPDVILNGRLEDRDGVAWATVAVADRETGLWLQADGTFGSLREDVNAMLSTCEPDGRPYCLPGVPNAGLDTVAAWSATLEMPAGVYGLHVTAYDNLGNVSTYDDYSFRVFDWLDTNPKPNAHPVRGATFTENPVTLTGYANDDAGISRVLVGIRDRTTGFWWDGSSFVELPGAWPAAAQHDASLARLGQPTSWSYAVTLPDGQYVLSLRAFDVQGYVTWIHDEAEFEVDTS